MRTTHTLLVSITLLMAAAPLAAQGGKPMLDLRAGVAVPTFDVADVVKGGFAFGAGLAIPVGERLVLIADFDQGRHKLKGATTSGAHIDVMHFMGKVGLRLGKPGSKVSITPNLGAGMLSFNPGGTGLATAETNSYFAINAGARIGIELSKNFDLLISPQGDIAFIKKADRAGFGGASTAWVWPFTAGLRIKF